MKRKMVVGLLIVLMTGMFASYAAVQPSVTESDEDLISAGLMAYALVHLYEGLHEWGFLPVPGLSGRKADDGSYWYTFTSVDFDGDGLFILNGTNKAFVSEAEVRETLDMTVQDGTTISYTIQITASGPPDEDLVMTSFSINGKSFTQSQIVELLGEDE